MAYSDRELLARLIQCEAGGEGDTGMKAVAGVVMNRVHARGGEYARVGRGSIRNIIFQPYQFVCASETERGTYNPQNIFNMRPEQIHFDIADWAIAGNRIPDVHPKEKGKTQKNRLLGFSCVLLRARICYCRGFH